MTCLLGRFSQEIFLRYPAIKREAEEDWGPEEMAIAASRSHSER
jgi:hypothetical protein